MLSAILLKPNWLESTRSKVSFTPDALRFVSFSPQHTARRRRKTPVRRSATHPLPTNFNFVDVRKVSDVEQDQILDIETETNISASRPAETEILPLDRSWDQNFGLEAVWSRYFNISV